jgi:hypothetical protein
MDRPGEYLRQVRQALNTAEATMGCCGGRSLHSRAEFVMMHPKAAKMLSPAMYGLISDVLAVGHRDEADGR